MLRRPTSLKRFLSVSVEPTSRPLAHPTQPAKTARPPAAPPHALPPALKRPAALLRLAGVCDLAVGETVILLHLPLPSAGVSIGMERGRLQK